MEPVKQHQILVSDPPGDEPRSSDPLVVLEHQHTVTLGYVRELDDAARSIREKGFTAAAFESIVGVAAVLGEFLRRHDELEEKHLFPAVGKIDPQTLKSFRDEHRVIHNLMGKLLSLVRDIEGGKIRGSSVGDLLRTVREIVALMRRHIIHENDILYPLIRETLGAAEIARIRNSIGMLEI
jgi:hemerythrin-like domain-containing protein